MWKLNELNDDRLVTTTYAAKLLGISVSTMKAWRYNSPPMGPPYRKLGTKLIRYRVGDLKKWSEKKEDA